MTNNPTLPDIPTQELLLRMGELTPNELRTARAAIMCYRGWSKELKKNNTLNLADDINVGSIERLIDALALANYALGYHRSTGSKEVCAKEAESAKQMLLDAVKMLLEQQEK